MYAIRSYYAYVKGGGLFVPSNRRYKLGDEVFMLLTLLDSKEKIPVAGHVVWITPAGAQGGRTAGIGIQFSQKDSGVARNNVITSYSIHYTKLYESPTCSRAICRSCSGSRGRTLRW